MNASTPTNPAPPERPTHPPTRDQTALPEARSDYPISGLHCASCAVRVETILKAEPGVADARVNLASATVALDYEPARLEPAKLKQALNDAGYDIIFEADSESAADRADRRKSEALRVLKRDTIAAALLTLPVVTIGMFFMRMPYADWIMLAFTTPVLFVYGRRFFASALRQLRRRASNMDTLVALSTGIAYIFSLFNTLYPEYWLQHGLEAHVYYEAAAAIVAFILLGKFLEERAKSATTSAIQGLLGGQPKHVIRIRHDGRNVTTESVIPIQDVTPGDILRVKPGEKIPVDGVVTQGSSFIDESMISGEPVPVEALPDKQVFAGTINQKGGFEFRAEKVGGETVLAGIVRMVKEAQGSKAPVQKIVDRVAAAFVPGVLGVSVLTFAVWIFAAGFTDGFAHALLAAVTVLVIACPCALGLATPTAIMVGIGKGATHNILIKDAESLELARQIDVVVLDKTGTITAGKPRVSDLLWTAQENRRPRLRNILSAIESRSEHPLATAVVQELSKSAGPSQSNDAIAITGFRSLTGRGVVAREGDDEFLVGSRELLRERGIQIPEDVAARLREWESDGRTVVCFADRSEVLAALAIADAIKATSRAAIRALRSRGVAVSMITGDNARGAAVVAREVGIPPENVFARALPADKARFVKELQNRGKIVAMVGDGINDSQALAQADVSIAMGHGSDIALDVAQIALLTSDLSAVPRAIQLSRETVRTIHQNLFWAFVYNLIGIPLAAGVLYPINGFLLNPMIAAAAMAFSSVSVVSNSLRVKWRALKRT
ncbi:MAG: heavy metal translocating P-type ATPase [Leptospirales bacterium]|jgi:Cu2+-exporting ATPase